MGRLKHSKGNLSCMIDTDVMKDEPLLISRMAVEES